MNKDYRPAAKRPLSEAGFRKEETSMKRVFLIVLDSVGIGELPDAGLYGDEGSNTVKAAASSPYFSMPNMKKLGFFNIDGMDWAEGEEAPAGAFGRLAETSKGKDTTTGHWEIAGLVSERPMPTFPDGFPEELLAQLRERTGRKILCNKPYSGTDVIRDYGEEHRRTGALIVYTSADSVLQIAAHESVIPVDELESAGIGDNPTDRCYRCKKFLFMQMLQKAEELGVRRILEGTNEDDLHVYRPGIRALKELGIKSPLADAGMTKADVRRLAAEYGMPVAAKPAAPCLATRFPYGTKLTYEKLEAVGKGEDFLKTLGFRNVRLRVHDAIARIEVDVEEFPLVSEHRKEIINVLSGLGYPYVTLDLAGFRSGSMDIGLDADR